MAQTTIDRLIVNSPCEEPQRHWRYDRETRHFFSCELETSETLIWPTEAPPVGRVAIEISGDIGAFVRLCCKMTTGSGKTIMMAMVIACHILNKVAYPKDGRFSKTVPIIVLGHVYWLSLCCSYILIFS